MKKKGWQKNAIAWIEKRKEEGVITRSGDVEAEFKINRATIYRNKEVRQALKIVKAPSGRKNVSERVVAMQRKLELVEASRSAVVRMLVLANQRLVDNDIEPINFDVEQL